MITVLLMLAGTVGLGLLTHDRLGMDFGARDRYRAMWEGAH